MDITGFLRFIGGLALFLYGMHVLGEGLAEMTGGKMEELLSRMTDSPFKGVLLGAGVTAVIQSSSAATVMVVGFVNGGIMRLEQAAGIILGANIGTTITSWILSLSGIHSDALFLQLLRPEAFSPVVAMTGVCLLMLGGTDRKKEIGGILAGFAVLMSGMDTMSAAAAPLRDIPRFTRLSTAFSDPMMGILAGALLTAVIQSSSASVGILQALCATGTIPCAAAIPIILGQNIGTCVTALISSIGASTNGRRAAFIHLYFNLIGTVIFLPVVYLLRGLSIGLFHQAATPASVALIHSCFNVSTVFLLLPFSHKLVELARLSVPDKAYPPRVTSCSSYHRSASRTCSTEKSGQ